jgi:hypothetical protein
MGKKVVDREGQEIGKVKDVGLAAVVPQLAAPSTASSSSMSSSTGQSDSGASRQQGASRVSIPESTNPGPRPISPVSDGRGRQEDPYLAEQRLRREVDRAGTPGSDIGMEASSDASQATDTTTRASSAMQPIQSSQTEQMRRQAASGGETRILVQPERSLGLSGDLVAIPASQIHREGDTLRVDMLREELRAIVARQPRASRVSMSE